MQLKLITIIKFFCILLTSILIQNILVLYLKIYKLDICLYTHFIIINQFNLKK